MILKHLRQLRRVLQQGIQLILGQLRKSGVCRREQRERSGTAQVIVQAGGCDSGGEVSKASIGANHVGDSL